MRDGEIDPVQHVLGTERLGQACHHYGRFVVSRFHTFHTGPHEKNTMISRTSRTSAKMIKSEERTTELVAERPTPSVPPCVRIPSKQAITPIMRPKTAVLKVGGKKS